MFDEKALVDKILNLEKGQQMYYGTQQGFREYVKSRVPEEECPEDGTLEKLYLLIAPRTGGLTMEGIV